MYRHLILLLALLFSKLTLALPLSLPAKTQSLGFLTAYIDTLTFDGKVPAVDESKKRIFVTVPESCMDHSEAELVVSITTKKREYTLYIDGKPISDGIKMSFKDIRENKDFGIQIFEGAEILASGTMVFSCLPLVQIYSDTTLNTTYALGRIVVSEPDKLGSAEPLLAELKTRGAYALKLEKKSFSIKLKEADGQTALDRSFFGLRNDNNWILDAMGIDPARMRNRVSTDLWNDFSTRPRFMENEEKMVNGTRGHYVEVFLNDSYNGLYCMTEKVDRKQLKLKKYIPATPTLPAIQRGGLFKGDNWTLETVMGNTHSPFYRSGLTIGSFRNSSESWKGFSMKYPDLGDGEPIDWKILYDAVVLCSDFTSDSTFNALAASRFDLPEILDYYLFLEFILAADNQGRNMYYATYDRSVSPLLFITPWDLDATWGRRWNGTSGLTGPQQDFDTFVNTYVQAQNNLFMRLKELNVEGFMDKLPERYRALRGNFFNENQIMNRFQNYYNLLLKSGAMYREVFRWTKSDYPPGSNFDLDFLQNWITSRIRYLDKQYFGGPYTSITETKKLPLAAYPNPVTDCCHIQGLHTGERIGLYTMQGKLTGWFYSEGTTLNLDLSGLSSGMYLLKASGEAVKLIKE